MSLDIDDRFALMEDWPRQHGEIDGSGFWFRAPSSQQHARLLSHRLGHRLVLVSSHRLVLVLVPSSSHPRLIVSSSSSSHPRLILVSSHPRPRLILVLVSSSSSSHPRPRLILVLVSSSSRRHLVIGSNQQHYFEEGELDNVQMVFGKSPFTPRSRNDPAEFRVYDGSYIFMYWGIDGRIRVSCMYIIIHDEPLDDEKACFL